MGGATFTVFYPFGYDPGDAVEDIRYGTNGYIEFETIVLENGSSYNAIVERS